MSKVSVASLGNPDRDGFLTKCGGSIKTWHKRWFVLKGENLYYFKSQKDNAETGVIKLEPTTSCNSEPAESKPNKKKFVFSVGVPGRKYMIYADTEECMKQWVDKIQKAIEATKGEPVNNNNNSNNSNNNNKSIDATPPPVKTQEAPVVTPPTTTTTKEDKIPSEPSAPSSASGDINTIAKAKDVIPFLQDKESKVLEFWQIWVESIPPKEEVVPGMMAIEYHISTSANMQKLTWRTAGPQNIFIQKMVDFFWNVGAPDSEIDRLNDVGALINPIKIGSWIDMSAKGGMDGGWYFPVDIPLKMAIEAADPGDPSRKVAEWAEKNSVENSFSVGRDMGAAPPRQTEIRLRLPGSDFNAQLNLGLDAFTYFGFPPLPENALSILREGSETGLCLSVITSSEGFVRLGLLSPKPTKSQVQKLCSIAGAQADDLSELESALGATQPSYVEYQFLKEGFGYGVYKEGFDIVFHYNIGGDSL